MALPAFYHLDLCSGSGMLGEAVRFALDGGIRTIAYVERESYAASALVARMDDAALDNAPIWDDVATCTGPDFLGYLRSFDPARIILTAGYPCQPFSVAGKRAGINDPRHLWPRINGLIGAIEPGIVFLENVPGHLRMGFAAVRRDLQRRGYRVAAGLFSASEVGASHRRERLFILAVRESGGCVDAAVGDAGGELADTAGRELSGSECDGDALGPVGEFCIPLFAPHPGARDEWGRILGARTDLAPAAEPDVRGVSNGLASGLDADRLRITGNGVVPLAAAYAFVTLASCLASEG